MLAIYSDIIRSIIKEIRKVNNATAQREDDQENLEDQMFKKELHEVGESLITEIHEESVKHGAIFVLVTQIEELHKASIKRGILSMDVSKALANRQFSLGEDLGHINGSGNGVLAWEIDRFLEENNVVPRHHRRSE